MNFLSRILTSLTALILVCTSCNQPGNLTAADQQLINEVGFDPDILLKIRSYTDSAFALSMGNPENKFLFIDSINYIEFKKKELKGLVLNSNTDKASRIVNKLENGFKRKGYMIYLSGLNYGFSPDKVTLLQTNDKFDLLRFEGTSGLNYDLYIEDIINQLKVWDIVYDLDFIAVGNDFIEAELSRLPKDLSAFCNELYRFCPDVVEQGTGTIEALEIEIVNSHKLFLWWD